MVVSLMVSHRFDGRVSTNVDWPLLQGRSVDGGGPPLPLRAGRL